MDVEPEHRRAGPWLDSWEEDIGLPGFYPFDALAALYVLHPQQFSCAKVSAWIAEDDRLTLPWHIALGSTGLLVGLEADRPQIARIRFRHLLRQGGRRAQGPADGLVDQTGGSR